MKRVSLIVISALLAGCSTLPRLPDEEQLSVAKVVKAVECELGAATRTLTGDYPFLNEYGIGLKLTIVIEEKAGFSPDLTGLIPIVRVSGLADVLRGSVIPGVHFDLSGTARRTLVMNFGYKVTQVVTFDCKKPPSSLNPLTAELGIYDTVAQPVEGRGNGSLGQFGTTIQFIAVGGGRLAPGVTLRRFSGPGQLTPSALLTGSRENNHTLDLTFTRLAPDPPPPLEVVIVGRRGVKR